MSFLIASIIFPPSSQCVFQDIFIIRLDMTKLELQGRMRICLESSYLLYTTKNFETLTNRFQLLNLHLSELAKYDSVEGYIETFTLAKQQDERDYADKGEMPEYQIAAVYKPSEFNLSDFYVTCICGCASRFGKEKVAEMNSMQKQTAKKKG